ncbi:hypothetical protein SRS16CHR_01798 [Variovorax sp. SRS16]|uniref:hypothetical protein n=1 Tax=Variovorax sp. SRS16 TaxID=282217 RepID=UPI00131843CA|nr:hypothetical protein [Variovorax sp. SRS16]VTU16526.1 hypothetical protein SRS16CHR_01798 [Variovorax sp. SRS16]
MTAEVHGEGRGIGLRAEGQVHEYLPGQWTLRNTAVHEMGHAHVALHFGVSSRVSIWHNGIGWAGRCHYQGKHHPRTRLACTVPLGGIVAEALLHGVDPASLHARLMASDSWRESVDARASAERNGTLTVAHLTRCYRILRGSRAAVDKGANALIRAAERRGLFGEDNPLSTVVSAPAPILDPFQLGDADGRYRGDSE